MYLPTYLLLLMVLLPKIAWGNFCYTVEVCNGYKCNCEIPASNTYVRHFYFNHQNIEKGNLYVCYFRTSFSFVKLELASSIMPKGVVIDSSNALGFFNQNEEKNPNFIIINTSNMINKVGDIIFRYAVAPSDMPLQVSSSCEPQNP